MIPILFEKTETLFTSNGIGRLTDCISCEVTEERNGIYEVELEYPITGKWYHEMITNGGIIGVIHDDNHDIQPFDIYMSSQPIDGVVTFYAHHISYRLNNIMLRPFTASSASAAVAAIATNSVNTNPFTFSTDKTVSAQFTLGMPASVRSILFGSDGSLLDTYGTAEFKFDKFNVQMLLHRGTDTGVTVRYGKNMTDIERTLDDSGTCNAIAPYWTDGVNVVYPDSIIVQPTTPITPLKPAAMDFSDRFEQQPTKAQLTSAARNYLDTYEPWKTDDNIKIDFIAMWQSPEYEDVAAIQRVGLCDTVSVYYTDMGIVAEKKEVVRVVFDVLAERFSELELGSVSNSYVAIDTGTQQGTVNIEHVLNGKVSKTGDTMTGTLKLPTVAPRAIEMTPLDGATNGGYIDFHYANSSADYTSRIIESTSGTISVIGNLAISNPLAVAQGGTGSTAVTTTSTITDIATAGGNTTITGATYAEWGKIASVQVILKRSINTGTNTDVTVATLVSGKRPAITSPAIVRYNGSNIFSYVASDGGIRINTATSIPANTELIIDAVYILA